MATTNTGPHTRSFLACQMTSLTKMAEHHWVSYTNTTLRSLYPQKHISQNLNITYYIHLQNFHSEANKLKRELSNVKSFFSVPELKIMILSVTWTLLGIVALVSLTHTIAQRTEYGQGIVQYSKCQLYGHNPNCMRRSEDMRIAFNIFNTFAILFFGLLPYPNIFFILKLSDLKTLANLFKGKRCFRGRNNS
jgi:hypothetical protein